jgi:hypothetical protein
MRIAIFRVAATISLVFHGCTTPPMAESKLVGTWVSRGIGATLEEANARPKPGEAVSKFVYYTDHTYVASRTGQKKTVHGTWRIEGDYLVERANGSSEDQRTFILQLTDTKLVFSGVYGTEGHWWRWGTF